MEELRERREERRGGGEHERGQRWEEELKSRITKTRNEDKEKEEVENEDEE